MASKTVKLPSGAEVVLKDPKTLRVRDRKKVFEQASNAKEGIMQALSLSDGLLAILIESWTLDLIIPSVRIDSIDEMEMADYDYLTEQTKDAQKVLFPSLSQTDETEKNPESPFGNSKD
jgi:hypothetical protein